MGVERLTAISNVNWVVRLDVSHHRTNLRFDTLPPTLRASFPSRNGINDLNCPFATRSARHFRASLTQNNPDACNSCGGKDLSFGKIPSSCFLRFGVHLSTYALTLVSLRQLENFSILITSSAFVNAFLESDLGHGRWRFIPKRSTLFSHKCLDLVLFRDLAINTDGRVGLQV